MKRFAKIVLASVQFLCASGLLAQDGTFWSTGNYDRSWSTSEYWRDFKVAKEGGVATLGEQRAMNQNVSGLELGGIVFNGYIAGSWGSKGVSVGFFGNTIAFVGDAFLDGSGSPIVNLTMDGKDSNTLTKRGSGTVTLGASGSFGSNLAEVSVRKGTLASIRTSGNAFPSAPLSIDGGTLAWRPASAADAVAAATTPALTAGAGRDVLAVNKGSGASATLTAASLALETGASLVIKAESGAAALGDTEKVKVATAPTLVNGVVDPRIVTRDWGTTPWQPWQFLTYDAERGFVPFAASRARLPTARRRRARDRTSATC